MRLSCPCGLHGSIEFFSDDAAARQFVGMLPKLRGIPHDTVIAYARLFSSPKQGLRWKKALSIAQELLAMVEAGGVDLQGRFRQAPASVIASAMQQMVDRPESLNLPLKSHGYLIRIIVGEAPKALAAAEEAGEQQKRVESQRRQGSSDFALAQLASERAALKRLGLPPMTPDQEAEFLARVDPK